ncbi:MAG: zinc ribbon domain-containing protein [Nitrospirae bacterium]|nr:zinc ribbon domain-containing protein [Nitrospirota bacterium]
MADILNKVMGGINKGVTAVSSKSKELIETTKLRAEIRDVEATIQSGFNDLGKKVFEMINKEMLNAEDLKTECVNITSFYKKISELDENIRKVEIESLKARHGADAVICQRCGSPNKADDKFCSGCGSPLATDVASDRKNCPACGAHSKEGAKFCMRCGGKLE